MDHNELSLRYEEMQDAINQYVDAEKQSTRDFMDTSVKVEEAAVLEVDGESYTIGDTPGTPDDIAQHIDVPSYPDPRENVTIHHDYPSLGLSIVLTGDLMNTSDYDIGNVLGNLVDAFVGIADA